VPHLSDGTLEAPHLSDGTLVELSEFILLDAAIFMKTPRLILCVEVGLAAGMNKQILEART